MRGAHLSEPDGDGIIHDTAHDGFICGHQGFGLETPAWAFMTSRTDSLDTITGMRAEFEEGVQRDPKGFSGSYQRAHLVSDLQLSEGTGLLDIRGEHSSAGFLGGQWPVVSPSVHLTMVKQSWFALASASTMMRAEAINVKSLA